MVHDTNTVALNTLRRFAEILPSEVDMLQVYKVLSCTHAILF